MVNPSSVIGRRVSEGERRRLFQALQDTGRGFPARARWLVAFANADLSAATDAELDRRRWEIIAWSLGEPGGLDIPRAYGRALSWSPLELLDREILVELFQRPLRDYLHAMVHEGAALIREAAGEPLLERLPDGTVTRRLVGSAIAMFFNAVSDVLVALGSRLRVCDPPVCERYVAAVGHYRYCSPACSQRVRTRRHESKRAEMCA
jgi:hypothetical protein